MRKVQLEEQTTPPCCFPVFARASVDEDVCICTYYEYVYHRELSGSFVNMADSWRRECRQIYWQTCKQTWERAFDRENDSQHRQTDRQMNYTLHEKADTWEQTGKQLVEWKSPTPPDGCRISPQQSESWWRLKQVTPHPSSSCSPSQSFVPSHALAQLYVYP